jgi:hypothetical protein
MSYASIAHEVRMGGWKVISLKIASILKVKAY